eukprot:967814_1
MAEIKALPLFIYVLIALAGGDRCHSNTSIPIQLRAHQSAYDIASQALYLFGGKLPQSGYSQSIYKWDINTDTWNELSTSIPTSTLQGSSLDLFFSLVNAAVTIQDIVYFIGMSDGYYNSGTVYRFHLVSLQWLSLSVTASPTIQHIYSWLAGKQAAPPTLINCRFIAYLAIYGALKRSQYHQFMVKVGFTVIAKVLALIFILLVGAPQ